jgi:hypothetical protein
MTDVIFGDEFIAIDVHQLAVGPTAIQRVR